MTRSIRIARGPRAVEASLLAALDAPLRECAAAGSAGISDLARPLRVIVPSRSLRLHLMSALVRRNGSLAGVIVQTAHAAALEMLERSDAVLPRSDLLFPLLVRRAARSEPVLRERLDPLVDGYGVVEANVRDLLDAGFEPALCDPLEDALAEESRHPALAARALAVLRVADRAVQEATQIGVGSRAALLRAAREVLQTDPERALPARAVFVHGFADATGVLGDLLEALVRLRGARVWVDRPPDPFQPGCPDPGAAFSERFVQRMTAAAGGEETETDAPAPPEVEVLHAPGPHAEVRGVAGRIRALLDAGVRPEAIGVVARQLAPFRLAIRLHFDRSGVPFSGLGARGPAGPGRRRLASLLALLRGGERAPVERWLDVLVALPQPEGALSRSRRADLRTALNALGAARLVDVTALEPPAEGDAGGGEEGEGVRLPLRLGLRGPEAERPVRAPYRRLSRAALAAALAAANAARARLADWPEHAPAAAHAARLQALLREDLGWRRGAASEPALAAALAVLSAQSDALPLGRDELVLALERALRHALDEPLGGRGAGVQVLDVMEARGRTFEHLFVLGMNRDLFPRAIVEDPLVPDGLRARLRAVLPDLPVKADGSDEERFLFAQLLASSAHVTLSASLCDDDGKARPLSPLLERLRWAPHVGAAHTLPTLHAREAAGPLRPAHERAVLTGLYAPRARFASALRVTLAEQGRDDAAARALAAGRMAVLEEMDPSLRRSRELGPYYGFLGAPAHPADPRRGPVYVTAVERMAVCPWQTLLGRLLRIEPPPDARGALPAGLDARLLGSLVHAVLDDIVKRALGDGPKTLEAALAREPAAVPWPDEAALAALLREHATRIARSEGVALPGYARVLALGALPRLAVARRHWPEPAPGQGVLGSEVEGCARVGPHEIRFRADRVDRTAEGIRLVDYKAGRPFATQKSESARRNAHLTRIGQGNKLQAAAYAMAGAGAGVPFEGAYEFLDPEAELAVPPARSDAAEFATAFGGAAGSLLDAWQCGVFFPRLAEPEKDDEPWACERCELKDACLRGDSGARHRLAEWVRRARSRREPEAVERALLGVWSLPAAGRNEGA